jgi:cobalt-zinc-cadmium efflux system membrane fusion protein
MTHAIRTVYVAAVLAVAMPLTACRHDAAAESVPPADAAADSPGAPRDMRVHLDDSQLAKITVEPASAAPREDVIRATGTVEFNGDRLARILSPVAGQVQDLRVNVGDEVKQGSTLFVLSSREVAAAIADRVASQRDLELSEKTYAMTQDLFEHEAASRMALQQAENDLAKARAKVAQAEEVLHVLGFDDTPAGGGRALASRMPIHAPISGTVTERTITNGQFVGNDSTALLTIADLSTVWVQADIFERDLHRIAAGQKADVTTAAYPDDHFGAEVARIGSVVDAQTRTAKMRFVVANPGLRLKPGMFTTAELHVPTQSPGALMLPMKAVFVEDGRSYAYVEAGRGTFVRREIETQPASGDRVRVSRGLAPGDRVVSDGVLLLHARESDGSTQ